MNKKWLKWIGIIGTAILAGVSDWNDRKQEERLEECEAKIAALEGVIENEDE